MKIKTKLIVTIALSMLIYTAISVFNTITLSKTQLDNRIKTITSEAYTLKKEELQNYSDIAIKVIDSYYQKIKQDKIEKNLQEDLYKQSDYLFNIIDNYYKTYHNKLSPTKLQTSILSIIKNARYDKDGYFWVNDMQPKMVMHPFESNLDGKDLSKFKDPNGIYPFNEMVKVVSKKGSGFVKYYWSKPKSDKPVEKISYVRIFKPYNWIIGTGVYVDDLKLKMQQEAMRAIKSMRYGNNGYFWINNMQNQMVMHPIKPQYDNKYFIDTPKVPFVQLGTDKLKEVKKDKAFIEYSFYTPATKKYSHKLSIVQRFKPWDWVIGTGAYTDYINAKILKVKQKAQLEVESNIIHIVLTSLFVLIIVLFIMIKLVENIIINPLNRFQKGLDTFFKFLVQNPNKIKRLNDDGNDEIALMAKEVNNGIEYAISTHKELLTLRQQLEQKVQETTTNLDKTKKEFDLMDQTRKETLAYGVLIQNSIIPDKKELNKAFSKHFIFDKQTDEINSQFYICESIRNNEYLFVIIDTKREGMAGILTAMLINALIKQFVTASKHETQREVKTSDLLHFINTQINQLIKSNTQSDFISKGGLDAAAIYLNKNTNILQYSGANIPLHYFKDDSFHIVKPTDKTIGTIQTSLVFEEHSIEVGEYLEFYLSTSGYIKEFIDIYALVSPFVNEKNIFEENIHRALKDTFVFGFQIDNKPKILLEYEGEITQKLINKYIEYIEDKIDNIGLVGNINTNFAEQTQNILHYAKSPDINNNEIVPNGYIILQKHPDGTYSLETKNIITLKDKQRIEPTLFEIQSLDKNGIRNRYRELRKSGKNTHNKGGGIGFYEIAKRSLEIKYEFKQINSGRIEFKFISLV